MPQRRSGSKRPIAYDTGYNLLPGAYKIKVLARDSETGSIGTYMGNFYHSQPE